MALRRGHKLGQVEQVLRTELRQGRWKAGDKLPTDAELAQRFDCSIGTANKAVALLVHDGLVDRRQGMGTHVLKNVPETGGKTTGLDAMAFVCPGEQHEGIWRVGRGFQEEAYRDGRRSITLSTGMDFRREAEIIGRLDDFDVKGAVLFPVVLNPRDLAYYHQMILACRFPVVLVEHTFPGLGRPEVVADGFHAGYTMTCHLLSQGLERIGFLGNHASASLVREKYLGYCKAMEEEGLEIRKDHVRLEQGMRPNFEQPLHEPETLAAEYLSSADSLEGVVCSVDFLAVGLMRAAASMGLRVPEDLKVVGIDDFAVAASSEPSLTTYSVPYEEIGRKACEILSGMIEGKPPEKEEWRMRGELVVRASS